ncbi:MAG: lipoprotein [Burkholderiales bacterium]|tara:strand:+ start:1180 stop:1344 length:165 start_codon:yes stop_codon:yes gene_type:complete
MTLTPKITIVILYFCLISGCGQTGALYLPDKPDTEKSRITTTQNSDQAAEIRQE